MRRLLITLLGTMLLGSALAEGDITLNCSTRFPPLVAGCFIEAPILVLSDFEVALGVDAQAVFSRASTVDGSGLEGHLAPFVVVAYYAETYSVWGEFRLPKLGTIPILGDPSFMRIGFSLRL